MRQFSIRDQMMLKLTTKGNHIYDLQHWAKTHTASKAINSPEITNVKTMQTINKQTKQTWYTMTTTELQAPNLGQTQIEI